MASAHDPRDAATVALAPPDPHVIVLFGATGDLARRKLLPGLLHLSEAGLMPASFRVVGTSLDELDDDGFRALARHAADDFARHRFSEEQWADFARRLTYVPHDAGVDGLARVVGAAAEECGHSTRLLHYLSVPPAAAGETVRLLGSAGLAANARVIMEKPFGTDLESACMLNAEVHEVFD